MKLDRWDIQILEDAIATIGSLNEYSSKSKKKKKGLAKVKVGESLKEGQ